MQFCKCSIITRESRKRGGEKRNKENYNEQQIEKL